MRFWPASLQSRLMALLFLALLLACLLYTSDAADDICDV